MLDPLTCNVYTWFPNSHHTLQQLCRKYSRPYVFGMSTMCVYTILRNVFIPYKGVVVGRVMECFELHQPALSVLVTSCHCICCTYICGTLFTVLLVWLLCQSHVQSSHTFVPRSYIQYDWLVVCWLAKCGHVELLVDECATLRSQFPQFSRVCQTQQLTLC